MVAGRVRKVRERSDGALTNGAVRTVKSCGPDASMVGVKSSEACRPDRAEKAKSEGDGGKQARFSGESAK